MKVPISFMTISAAFEADMPDTTAAAPSASAAWSYHGDRYVTYTPAERFEGLPADEFETEFETEVDGVPVQAYRRRESPAVLSATWRLSRGWLQTFVDEPIATPEELATVVRSIDIDDDGDRIVPKLSFRSPLDRTPPVGPSRKNSLAFLPSDPADWWPYVELTEVGTGIESPAAAHRSGDAAVAMATLPVGVTVRCTGPAEERDVLANLCREIADSLRAT